MIKRPLCLHPQRLQTWEVSRVLAGDNKPTSKLSRYDPSVHICQQYRYVAHQFHIIQSVISEYYSGSL